LVPINFSYATSYRLLVVTFALGHTVHNVTDRRRRTQHRI